MNLLEPVAAQTWSDPVKINNLSNFSDADFTIDKNGVHDRNAKHRYSAFDLLLSQSIARPDRREHSTWPFG